MVEIRLAVKAAVSAVVTRADGTIEDLGVISIEEPDDKDGGGEEVAD